MAAFYGPTTTYEDLYSLNGIFDGSYVYPCPGFIIDPITRQYNPCYYHGDTRFPFTLINCPNGFTPPIIHYSNSPYYMTIEQEEYKLGIYQQQEQRRGRGQS